MSEKEPLEKLAKDMLESMAVLRKLVINQQETLAGIAAMMKVHTTSLRMHQKIIEALAAESGRLSLMIARTAICFRLATVRRWDNETCCVPCIRFCSTWDGIRTIWQAFMPSGDSVSRT